jgi:RimJ/RimL family protein N-acetyltransferase
MDPVTLTSARLLLRPPRPGDTEAIYSECQDSEIQRWTAVPSPYTWDDAVHFIERMTPHGWREDVAYIFGCFVQGTGVLVGTAGLVRMTPPGAQERQAELGYWTAKGHRGQGYAAEAGRTVARWAFQSIGVERLEWYAEAGNEASRAVARRIGFMMEGTLRSRIVQAGTRRDAWIGSLLPSDLGCAQSTTYLPAHGS